MFNLKLKVNFSDILIVMGTALITIGIFLIYRPAALIFAGAALITLAWMTYKPPEVK